MRTVKRLIALTLIAAPACFAVLFGALVVRARVAFGDWPRLSANDPWELVNRAPRDGLFPLFSYASHIDLIYWAVPFMAIGVLAVPAVAVRGGQAAGRGSWRALVLAGWALTLFLLFFQWGRFAIWFLD